MNREMTRDSKSVFEITCAFLQYRMFKTGFWCLFSSSFLSFKNAVCNSVYSDLSFKNAVCNSVYSDVSFKNAVCNSVYSDVAYV